MTRSYWLFSAPVDLAAFAGSAALALSLLWIGSTLGVLHSDTPDWTWITAVLLVDVAHVYATDFASISIRWFLDRDFVALPAVVERVAAPLYWGALGLYAARAVYRGVVRHEFNPGKDVVVVTTAVCWHVGIVTFNSDYAFTVTNVIIHGVPYFVLVYRYVCHRAADAPVLFQPRRIAGFVAALWLAAYVEELLWDKSVWHTRSWLLGSAWDVGSLQTFLVPLLAVPQITHYVLDGFLWRRSRTGPIT